MKKDKPLKEEAWDIARKCLEKVPKITHGINHVQNVYKHFERLEFSSKQEKNIKEVVEDLEYAVILHDIGNRDTRKDHNKKSIIILKKEYKSFYSRIPKEIKEYMEYAIKNHSGGNRKDNNKDRCLSLLSLLDNMDAVGKKGRVRIKEYLKEKLGQEKSQCKKVKVIDEQEKIDDYINNPEKIKQLFNFKDCHVFLNLLCNYYWIDKNLERVEDLLSEGFKEYYKKLKKETESILKSFSKPHNID